MGNFIDAVARAVRQASSRACNAFARAGILPTHLIAVLSHSLCENLGSLEDLFNRYCKRQSALEAEVEEAEAAEAANVVAANAEAVAAPLTTAALAADSSSNE